MDSLKVSCHIAETSVLCFGLDVIPPSRAVIDTGGIDGSLDTPEMLGYRFAMKFFFKLVEYVATCKNCRYQP